MDGRWAQLAVEAHIAHAIDYSKPRNKAAEKAIFDNLEIKRIVATLPLIRTASQKEETERLKNMIVGAILPWYGITTATATDNNNPFNPDKLKKLQAYNQQLKQQNG